MFDELSVRTQEDITNDILGELAEEGKIDKGITLDVYLNDPEVFANISPLVDERIKEQFIGVISY